MNSPMNMCAFFILPKWLFQFILSSAKSTYLLLLLLIWLILSKLETVTKLYEKCHLICISIHITRVGHFFRYLLIRFGFDSTLGLIQPCCTEYGYSCKSFSEWVRPAKPSSKCLLAAMLFFNSDLQGCQSPRQSLIVSLPKC